MFTMASSEREAEPRDCVAVPSATSANKFAPATTRGRDAELAQAVSIWVSLATASSRPALGVPTRFLSVPRLPSSQLAGAGGDPRTPPPMSHIL